VRFSVPFAFSDASSGIGVGIIIRDLWCGWRLIPGWQTANNAKRDIGWAKEIGFKPLVCTLTTLLDVSEHIIIYGDNTRVVKGWWKGCHCNKAVNDVFKWVHEYIHTLPRHFKIRTEYITSEFNPADGPSRGQYGPEHLLLPQIPIPSQLKDLIVNATSPITPTEFRLLCNGHYTPPAAKVINWTLMHQQAIE
jgi:hypothetical protein